METGAIISQSPIANTAQVLHKRPIEEQAETVDSTNEERIETAIPSSQSAESRLELSESGLKLSSNFQNRASETNGSTIENNEQAQQAINELNIAVQKSPDQAGAAQNNLTSNVVKSLLG